ncbi:hypothetical protein HC723_01090 [Vibrio sp. S11_S32]|uniref:hemerythrin domain-containing protein n=1 Tax=Vibrio sp. S11_S32 TaxID=2720225 RepID=UPI00168164A8|nr:hemerythrin domain-containing protein [Vibrio sp. S11_S32]MBD1575059.1 hypothetical protein [Vibrio sp. S11_S32]
MSMQSGEHNLTQDQLQQLSELPLDQLTDVIVAGHHDYIRATGPELICLGDTLLNVHGADSDIIRALVPLIHALVDDLTPHLYKEEQILFPAIQGLATGQSVQSCFGHVSNPIRMMMHEHTEADNLAVAMQKVTNHFNAPEGACNTWRKCYQLLEEFCQDLVNHIHVEDTILFPKAITLADA